MDRNQYLLAIAAALLLLLMRRGGARGSVAPCKPDTSPNAVRDALRAVRDRYGAQVARDVERIYRLETRHFDSGQFRATGSAGQIAAKPDAPPLYGWRDRGLMREGTCGLWWARENDPATGQPRGPEVPFVAWRSVRDAALYLAAVIVERGRPGAWKSTDPAKMDAYEQALRGVRTDITDTL